LRAALKWFILFAGDFLKRVFFVLTVVILNILFYSCELDYGKLGGADETYAADVPSVMESKTGVWYSHYGDKRLDGYTIGKWKDVETEMGGKLSVFPEFKPSDPKLHDGYQIKDDDYYIFYDDTVYGQTEDGVGGAGGWNFAYMGIVRAVNIFNGEEGTGAIIIEYLDECYPTWSKTVTGTPLPFFGVYYRVLEPDVIQFANAIILENLYAGKAYHTETATLEQAIRRNNAKNSGEFISWGVVIPQEREK
jgi:hypothetical protein